MTNGETPGRDLYWARHDLEQMMAYAAGHPTDDPEQDAQRDKVLARLVRVVDRGDQAMRAG